MPRPSALSWRKQTKSFKNRHMLEERRLSDLKRNYRSLRLRLVLLLICLYSGGCHRVLDVLCMRNNGGMIVGFVNVYCSVIFAQSQKVERLQSEMKTQEQQMEDIDGAKKKITVSALGLTYA